MANHRWDTEPPAALPSRLAARRRAAGLDPSGGLEPGQMEYNRDAPESGEEEKDLPAGPEREASGLEQSVSPENQRRWSFPLRAGILAACLMLAVAAAVPLLRDRASSDVLSVELGSTFAATSAGERPEESAPADGDPPQSGSAAAPSGGAAAPGGQDAAGSPAGTELVVHVAGAVSAPGLVRVPEGSRVADAVAAAGGATGQADLTRVNLAAPMTDGSMVVIPAQGDPGGPVAAPGPGTAVQELPGSAAGAGTGAGAAVNLNTAGEAELQTLPRVGPVLAARIIAWRTEHGPFQRAEDLDAVPGIGEAMLAALLPLVVV